MNSSNIRILPIMIITAFLAFSVRLGDVAVGVSSLGGVAQAEEKKKDKKEKMSSAKETATAMDKDHGDDHDESMMSEDSERIGSKWRDASDEELDFRSVKMDVFDDLSARRKALNKRERELGTREALIKAAEQELDRKYKELSDLRGEIVNLLEQQSGEEKARIESLVKIYEGMKPKDAARIFDTLDLDILVSVMSLMSERKLSPVLAAMNAERARTITIMLAEQKKLPELPQ